MFSLIICFLISKTLTLHSTFPEIVAWFNQHFIIAIIVALNLVSDVANIFRKG